VFEGEVMARAAVTTTDSDVFDACDCEYKASHLSCPPVNRRTRKRTPKIACIKFVQRLE